MAPHLLDDSYKKSAKKAINREILKLNWFINNKWLENNKNFPTFLFLFFSLVEELWKEQ